MPPTLAPGAGNSTTARRASHHAQKRQHSTDSWAILGTNLSYKETANGAWATDASRLLIADRRDFNKLGIGTIGLVLNRAFHFCNRYTQASTI